MIWIAIWGEKTHRRVGAKVDGCCNLSFWSKVPEKLQCTENLLSETFCISYLFSRYLVVLEISKCYVFFGPKSRNPILQGSERDCATQEAERRCQSTQSDVRWLENSNGKMFAWNHSLHLDFYMSHLFLSIHSFWYPVDSETSFFWEHHFFFWYAFLTFFFGSFFCSKNLSVSMKKLRLQVLRLPYPQCKGSVGYCLRLWPAWRRHYFLGPCEICLEEKERIHFLFA